MCACLYCCVCVSLLTLSFVAAPLTVVVPSHVSARALFWETLVRGAAPSPHQVLGGVPLWVVTW